MSDRHYLPFCRPIVVLSGPFVALSQPFPVLFHITFQLKTCPVLSHKQGRGTDSFSWGEMLFARRYILCIFVGDAVGRRQTAN